MAEGADAPDRPRREGLLALLVVVALGAIAYGDTFRVPFAFDDLPTIIENEAIRDLGDVRAWAGWVPPRLVATFTLAVNYALGGLDVRGYHVVNLAIHLAASLAVFFLLSSLFALDRRRRPDAPSADVAFVASLVGAAVYVAHPLQTQAVTYIWQRVASIAALFYVLALLFHVRAALARGEGRDGSRLEAVAFGMALLAMFTKQQTVTLPAAVVLIDLVLCRGEPRREQWRRWALWAAMVLVIPLTILVFGDVTVDHMDSDEQEQLSVFRYVVTQIDVVALYFRLALVPIGQSLQHEIPPSTLLDLGTLLNLALHLTLLSAGAVLTFRRRSLVGLGILLGYLMLSVESAVPLLDVAFEHRMYLPFAGFLLAAAAALAHLRAVRDRRMPTDRRFLVVGVVFVVALPLALVARARNEVWQTEVGLWTDAASKYPESWRSQYKLGLALRRAGQADAAVRTLERAVALKPDHAVSRMALGVALAEAGREDASFAELKRARELDPRSPRTAHLLAISLVRRGDREAALALLDEQMSGDPPPPAYLVDFRASILAEGR